MVIWASAPSSNTSEAPGYPLYLSKTPFWSIGEDAAAIPLANG